MIMSWGGRRGRVYMGTPYPETFRNSRNSEILLFANLSRKSRKLLNDILFKTSVEYGNLGLVLH